MTRMEATSLAQSDQLVSIRLGWAGFELIQRARGESRSPRITYLDGVLELLAPSKSHEGIKSRIGRLLEMWAALEGIAVSPFGSTTLKKRRGKAVAEPDECYVVGRSDMASVPDIAIEVNWSRSGIDKLEVYERLGVPEVWLWENDRIGVFALKANRYAKRKKSAYLPTLDLEWLARFVADPDHTRAVANLLAEYRSN